MVNVRVGGMLYNGGMDTAVGIKGQGNRLAAGHGAWGRSGLKRHHGMAQYRDLKASSDGNISIAAAEVQSQNSSANDEKAHKLVDELVTLVEGTDGGVNISSEDQSKADIICDSLAEIGQGSRPLTNDLIFGNYEVAYVSKGSRQYGQPAGGRFRTGLGKWLFSTARLCQSVIRPNIVTNKIDVSLFGFLPCSVGLRGTLQSIPESPDAPNNEDTVKVFFEPPVLSLPFNIHTRFGPPSSVILKTTYLDEKVRLGLGSRGSRFVFVRGGEADKAGMDQVGLEKTSSFGKLLIFSMVSAMIVGGSYMAQNAQLPTHLRSLGIVGILIGAAVGGVFWRGGIINDPEERPEITKAVA